MKHKNGQESRHDDATGEYRSQDTVRVRWRRNGVQHVGPRVVQGLPVARPCFNRVAVVRASSSWARARPTPLRRRVTFARGSRAPRRFRPSTAARRSWPKCIAALAKLGLPEDLVEKELGGHAAPYCTVVTTVLNITLCDTCVSRNDTRAPLLRRGSRRLAHATATRSLRRDRRPASPAGARELPSP